jgi:hypothetical protein
MCPGSLDSFNTVFCPKSTAYGKGIIRDEVASNGSSGLRIWDYLHGTLELNVLQNGITIGVPSCRDESEVGLAEIVVMPFKNQRPTWCFPKNGERSRTRIPRLPTKLLA